MRHFASSNLQRERSVMTYPRDRFPIGNPRFLRVAILVLSSAAIEPRITLLRFGKLP